MRNILNKLFKVKKKKKYRDVFYVKNYYINKQTVSYKLNDDKELTSAFNEEVFSMTIDFTDKHNKGSGYLFFYSDDNILGKIKKIKNLIVADLSKLKGKGCYYYFILEDEEKAEELYSVLKDNKEYFKL